MSGRGGGPDEEVLGVLERSGRALKAREIAQQLGLARADARRLRRLLEGMQRSGQIRRVKGHRFVPATPKDRRDGSGARVTGLLSVTRRGDGFVRVEGGEQDVFVPREALASATDGDRVAARIERRPRGRNPEGYVVEVLERARDSLVGVYQSGKRFSFVVPMAARLHGEVIVSADGHDARDGDVVLVRLTSHGQGKTRSTGLVERVLGQPDDPGVDVLAVALGFELPIEFATDVLEAAEQAAEDGTSDPGPNRVDRTDLLCFTIDPADAKDHDDALTVERLDDGRSRVGVHIADVSHFVRPGSPVDLEAYHRGTSVYLVDRAIPMLPAVLSSDACSLMQEEDRLAVSVFMTLDREGVVRERSYERTIVRCRHALSYEDAQSILDGETAGPPDVADALRTLDDYARAVRADRRERGALDLDLPEAAVLLDDVGQPVDIRRRQRLESHRLIEDYMILANEVVAHDLQARELPALYRVHEAPSAEALADLAETLAPLGINVPMGSDVSPSAMQTVLESARGPEARTLVSTLVLRTLEKARYDTHNLGHFGLASDGYTHFTSPIRRYPDLVVHRVLTAALIDGAPTSGAPIPTEHGGERDLEAVADRTSERERVAEEAERATVDLKKVEYMERHVGDEFAGRVTGVAAFGLFVTLEEVFVEGLVHVRALEDDFYRFDESAYALVGSGKGRRFALGDRLHVQVARVDKQARHIDFVLIEGPFR